MSATEPKTNSPLLFLVIFSWVFAASLAILNLIGAVPYYVDGTPPTVSEVHLEGEEQIVLPEDTEIPEVPENQPIAPVVDAPVIENPSTVTKPPVAPSTPPAVQPVTPTQPTPREVLTPEIREQTPERRAYLPETIVIPSLKKTIPVSNPQSRDVSVLDKALLKAVVRYPGSGLLGQEGNIFIFGHSTGYRTVNNALFKAFNGIQNLEEGSVIELHGKGKIHIYQVTKVTKADANEALVDLKVESGQRKLTLSTCDSFGKKTSRFVVEAAFLSEFAQ